MGAVSKAILEASETKRKLKCLSINGCQIDDSNLRILAPALVTLQRLHIADNPDITGNGWKVLKDSMGQSSALKFLSLKHSEHSKKNIIRKDDNMLLHLVNLLSQFEKVDISGQKEVTNEIIDQLDELCTSKNDEFKLSSVIVSRAYYKPKGKSGRTPSFKIECSDNYGEGQPRWKTKTRKSIPPNNPLSGTKDQINN